MESVYTRSRVKACYRDSILPCPLFYGGHAGLITGVGETSILLHFQEWLEQDENSFLTGDALAAHSGRRHPRGDLMPCWTLSWDPHRFICILLLQSELLLGVKVWNGTPSWGRRCSGLSRRGRRGPSASLCLCWLRRALVQLSFYLPGKQVGPDQRLQNVCRGSSLGHWICFSFFSL